MDKWSALLIAASIGFFAYAIHLASQEKLVQQKIDACGKLPSETVGKCLGEIQ